MIFGIHLNLGIYLFPVDHQMWNEVAIWIYDVPVQWWFLVGACKVYVELKLHGCRCYIHHPSSRVAISPYFLDTGNFLSIKGSILLEYILSGTRNWTLLSWWCLWMCSLHNPNIHFKISSQIWMCIFIIIWCKDTFRYDVCSHDSQFVSTH